MAYTTIDDPSAYFQTTLYTGDGASSLAITNSGNSDLQADWIWIKERNGTRDHSIFDSVRGVAKRLESNTDNAEGDETAGLLSLNSDGFTVGADGYVNTNNNTYVAWCWKESANAGFDIITYNGTSSNRTISHNLSAIPKMILSKRLDSGNNWHVYHVGIGNTKGLYLDTTSAEVTSTQFWNDTSPTSSVYTLGIGAGMNASSATYVNYVFADVQGFSKFGSYTGNGNADGTFVYTGFKPAWIMIKESSHAGNAWHIRDIKRSPINVVDDSLYANENIAEVTNNTALNTDFLSNGFKLRNTDTNDNGSGRTYIYMCFAESPLVNSNGVPCNAR